MRENTRNRSRTTYEQNYWESIDNKGFDLEITPEQSLNFWKAIILIIVSLSLGVYFLLVCIKADDRSTFNHLYIFFLCASGHLAALIFFISYASRVDVPGQQRFTAAMGCIVVFGSFLTQLLLALKMDLVIMSISYSTASIPFMASMIAVSIIYGTFDANWYIG